MKRYKLFIIVFILFAVIVLDWVALHDILKGKQDDYTDEYIMPSVSVLILGAAGYLFIAGKVNNFRFRKS
jgi:hypothetical protein